MKKTLLILALTATGTLYAGHQAVNADIPTIQKIQQHQDMIRELQEELHVQDLKADSPTPAPMPETTPTAAPKGVEPTEAPAPAPEATPIDIYEDGSAKMSDGTTRPEGTYPWDCTKDGNKVCGTEVNGTWYLLDFNTMTFTPRD